MFILFMNVRPLAARLHSGVAFASCFSRMRCFLHMVTWNRTESNKHKLPYFHIRNIYAEALTTQWHDTGWHSSVC